MNTYLRHSKFGMISDSVLLGSPFIWVKLICSQQWGTSLLREELRLWPRFEVWVCGWKKRVVEGSERMLERTTHGGGRHRSDAR